MASPTHDIVIVGAGTAGIYTAALLRKKRPELSVTLVDPSDVHYYQPGFTIVGGGEYSLEKTKRRTRDLIPAGAKWIQAKATELDPDKNEVALDNGERLQYRWLVACPGLSNDWNKVAGLLDTVGKNGVCSNYSPDYVNYTWRLIDGFKGGPAIFTQPPMPIKCPGAPQKIAYLAADRWRQRGFLDKCDMHFMTAAGAMFGVAPFSAALDKVVARYGIKPHFFHNLVAVDGDKKTATFEKVQGDTKELVTYDYGMLHVTPPETTPAFVKQSPLANSAGFIEVNQSTLRHVRYENVFALGDACSTPNSKTAAAIRKQAPVLVKNLLSAMKSEKLDAVYDGYGSCPLTTSLNTVMLAEFIYGGKVTPTFPLNPFVERQLWWWGKKVGFPLLYWQMLKGLEFDISHSEAKAQPYLAGSAT